MASTNKTFIVICEGASEDAYLIQLNRIFREEEIPLNFVPRPVGCGDYPAVEKKYKTEHEKNPRSRFLIWIDNDIYKRNTKDNKTNYQQKPAGIPDFLFNYYNFEDILALHLEDTKTTEWERICEEHNHFETPMVAAVYEPLFTENIIKDYKKGTFPPIELNLDIINSAIDKNNDESIKLKSDFLKKLEELIKTYSED